MRILFIISLMYVIIYTSILISEIHVNIKISRIIVNVSSILIVISMVIITACIKPDVGYDLSRHFEIINNYRIFGPDFKTQYDNLFIIKIIFYLISLLPYNEILPSISVALTYGTFTYITNHFIKKYNIGRQFLLISWLVNLSLIPYIVSYSGIRTSMAMSFIALAIYRDFELNKKNIITLALYIIPLFIHPISISFLLLKVIHCFKCSSKKFYFVCCTWSMCIIYIIKILKLIPLEYLQFVGNKIEYYFYNFTGNMKVYYITILYILFLILLFRRISINKDNNIHKYDLIRYINLLLYFILGSFKVPSLLIRMSYFIGFFAFPIVYMSLSKLNKNNRLFAILVLITLSLSSLTYQYMDISNSSSYISFELNKVN